MTLEVAKGIVRLAAGSMPAVELGFRPRALVLWWCGEPAAGCTGGIGFATDGAGEASAAWAADDAIAPGVLAHCGADTALLLHADPRLPDRAVRGRIVLAERGFSIGCDREPEQAWLVHYLALGGPDLRNAAVRTLVLADEGERPVTGVGFAPDAVLAIAGAGSAAGGAQPGIAAGFGAAVRASSQTAAGFVAQAVAGQAAVRGAHCTGAIAALPEAAAAGEMDVSSRVASFDSEGFTLDTVRLASELPLAVLALEGGSFAVGLGDAASRTTAVGFEPAGAFLFGTGLAAMARPRDIGRLCVGAFSRDRAEGCVSWSVRARGAWPLEPSSRSAEDGVFEVVDTASRGLHARATLSSLGRRGFSLAWPVRDRYRRDFGYVAFGPVRPRRTFRDRLRLLGRGRPLPE